MNAADELAFDGDMRTGSMFTRYHVGVGITLLETFRCKSEAFAFAVATWNKEGEPVDVFDSMARVGAAELWTVQAAPGVKLGMPILLPPVRRKAAK